MNQRVNLMCVLILAGFVQMFTNAWAGVQIGDVQIKGYSAADYVFSSTSTDAGSGKWNTGNTPAFVLVTSANTVAAAAETAVASFTPATSGMYDMAWYGLVRSDFPPDGRIKITYRPGGSYAQQTQSVRVVSASNDNAAGIATIVCNFKDITPLGTFTQDQIYLGRYELQAGQTYTITQTTAGVTPGCFWHLGYMSWGGPQASSSDLVYSDADCMVGEEYWGFDVDNAYFWRGHYKPEGILRGVKVFPMPGSDRTQDGTYEVFFNEVFGGPDEPADLPVTVYFEPTYRYEPPTVDGTIVTGVDSSSAINGYVTVRVNTQAAHKVSLGRYVYLKNKNYAVEVRDFPIDTTKITGNDVFIRKNEVTLENYQALPALPPAPLLIGDTHLLNWENTNYVFSSSSTEAGSGQWNHDVAPGFILMTDANVQAAGAETATASFIPFESGMYDLTWYAYMRNDYVPNGRLEVTFKPGGQYQPVFNGERVVSVDTAQAAAGKVAVIVNCVDANSLGMFDRDQIYLGRYELAGGQTYTLKMSTQGATPGTFWAVGSSAWTGPQQPSLDHVYSEADAAVGEEYWGWEGEPHNYYWRGHAKAEDILRGVKVFPLPASDRATSATGAFDVYFEEVFGGTDQPKDLKVTVYFEPGSIYEVPTVAGMITGVNSQEAARGIITLSVNTQSPGRVKLGKYWLENDRSYAVEVRDHPVDEGEIAANDVFIRKEKITLENFVPEPNAAKHWTLY
jgi:hypothetical protein